MKQKKCSVYGCYRSVDARGESWCCPKHQKEEQYMRRRQEEKKQEWYKARAEYNKHKIKSKVPWGRSEPRPPGWHKKRNTALKEGDHRCVRCGAEDKLQVDHIVPRAAGGSDEQDNLQVLCKKCHWEKTSAFLAARNRATARYNVAPDGTIKKKKNQKGGGGAQYVA